MGNSFCVRKNNKGLQLAQVNGQCKMKELEVLIDCKMINRILHNRFLTCNWEEFTNTYMIDEKYGISFDWDSVPLDAYYDQWIEVCQKLPELNSQKRIKAIVSDLPLMDLQYLKTEQQKVKAISQLIFIINSYLFNEFPNVPQVLPKNLSVPLYLLANNLGTKPSLGWVENMCNWKVKNDNKEDYLNIDNLQLRFSFTGRDDEQIFYLLSNLADFRMAKLFRSIFKANQVVIAFLQHNLYQMTTKYFLKYFMNEYKQTFNYSSSLDHYFQEEKEAQIQIKPLLHQLLSKEEQIVEIVLQCFEEMINQLKEITKSLKLMFTRNDADFFFNTLRNYLQGFARPDVFPDGLFFEGVEVRVKSEGGSGGNSASFQIFERSMGIWFEGELNEVQKVMKQGMLRNHLKLIQFMRQNSILRTYALITRRKDIKEAYNDVVQSYIDFNAKHLYYVEHYIEKQIKKKNPEIDTSKCKGTGDVFLSTIKDRYKKFQCFFVEI